MRVYICAKRSCNAHSAIVERQSRAMLLLCLWIHRFLRSRIFESLTSKSIISSFSSSGATVNEKASDAPYRRLFECHLTTLGFFGFMLPRSKISRIEAFIASSRHTFDNPLLQTILRTTPSMSQEHGDVSVYECDKLVASEMHLIADLDFCSN